MLGYDCVSLSCLGLLVRNWFIWFFKKELQEIVQIISPVGRVVSMSINVPDMWHIVLL